MGRAMIAELEGQVDIYSILSAVAPEPDPRYTLHCGDSRVVLADMAENSVDAVVTDPPYELGFMGKRWDNSGIAYDVGLWREVLRVAKPGAHLLAFGGTRTSHRMVCAIEDAGWEIRDSITSWVYATGFPKSLDIGKAIDKAERGFTQGAVDPTSANHGKFKTIRTEGLRSTGDTGQGYGAGPGQFMAEAGTRYDRELTDAAKQWDGWGTALKPASEPICLARKPVQGTIAANVLAWGTGGLNIDASRINNDGTHLSTITTHRAEMGYHGGNTAAEYTTGSDQGRWPANVVFDGDAAAELDRQSGVTKSGGYPPAGGIRRNAVYGTDFAPRKDPSFGHSEGGASRFFYVSKPSRTERDAGCANLPDHTGGELTDRAEGSAGLAHPRAGAGRTSGGRCTHPTVKPLTLMRYLVKLITPPGGVVLDPFTGSGTTGAAALAGGFRFVGIEREAEYVELAHARIKALGVSTPTLVTP